MMHRETTAANGSIFLRVGPLDPEARKLLDDAPRLPSTLRPLGTGSHIELVTVEAQDLFARGSQEVFKSLYLDRQVLLLDYAYGFLPSTWLKQIPWTELQCAAATIETVGLSPTDIKQIRSTLRKAGLHPAGGGLRASGTDELFVRLTGPKSRIDTINRQFRWRIGKTIVWVRANLTNPAVRRARWNHLARWLNPRASKTFVLDSRYGLPLTPVNPLESLSAALTVKFNSQGDFQVSSINDEEILTAALKCHDQHNVWPISFSFPQQLTTKIQSPNELLSEVVPGQPYSFADPDEYLSQYANARLAITHRKAGWDCFRHVEILSAGAVPLMLDADQIPEYSMTHYPKLALREVRDHALLTGELPDANSRTYFSDFFNRHLTSLSMAKYMLSQASLPNAQSVLFIDDLLPTSPDYQSVLALIGLKQLLGPRVSVRAPVEYLYTDWQGDERSLYGRGFGYTRILDPSLRSASELKDHHPSRPYAPKPGDFDAVVVGSIQRNTHQALAILSQSSPSKTIWIHGADLPPSWQQTEFLRSSKTHVFVRSIH